jgi:hypothetical protein
MISLARWASLIMRSTESLARSRLGWWLQASGDTHCRSRQWPPKVDSPHEV